MVNLLSIAGLSKGLFIYYLNGFSMLHKQFFHLKK